MNVGILAVKIGDVFECFLPGSFIELERNDRFDGEERLRFGEIVNGIGVGGEALEFGLFLGECLAGSLVGIVGSQPDLMAERDGIIVERKNRGFAFAARVSH